MIAIMNEKTNRSKLLAAIAVLAMVVCVFAIAMPAEDTDAAAGDVTYLSGTITSSQSFGEGTIVVVNGDLNIPADMSLTINDGANFTVNEGATLTIGNGGVLTINAGATVNVDGAIEVDRQGQFYNNATYSATETETTGLFINGSLSVARNGSINGSSNGEGTYQTGTIILGENATMEVLSNGRNHGIVQNQNIIMDNGAVFTLNGDVDNVTITAGVDSALKTTATIDYEIPAEAVSSYNRLVFTATASDIAGYTDGENGVVQTTVSAMSLDISGALITGTLTVAGDESSNVYADEAKSEFVCIDATVASDLTVGSDAALNATHIDVAGTLTAPGDIAITDAGVSGTLTATGNSTVAGDIAVSGTVTFSGNFTYNAATFDVSGTLTVNDEDGYANTGDSYLNILEEGTATILGYTDGKFTAFSGAYYTDADTAYFSGFSEALAGAIEANAYDVYLSGYENHIYSIAEDVTIDSGIAVYVDGIVQIDEGYTLTIDDGDITSVGGVDENKALIIVNGTLVDNIGHDFVYSETQAINNGADVLLNAEVMSTDEDETYYSYTTLANALSGMTSGTVSLFGNVDVDANLEIPEGVTVNTNNRNLTIANGVELTVNGVIDLTDGGNIAIAPVSGEDAVAGTVTVNNYIAGATVDAYSGIISGFYATGNLDSYNNTPFVMSASVAEANSDVFNAIAMYGTLTVEDLSFTNTADDNKVLSVYGQLTAGTITIDGYTVSIEDVAVFNGTVANTEGSVVLTNIRGVDVADTTVDDADRLVISGTPALVEGETEALTSTITFAGTVYMGTMDLDVISDVSVAADATVNVTGAITNVDTLTVEGEFIVENGASVGASVLNVIGTVTVAAATDDAPVAGVLNVEDIYAGITEDDVNNGTAVASTAAVIDGAITITGYAYIAPGATLSEGFTEGMNSAMFSVEGSEWFTVYSNSNTTMVSKAPIANGYFLGWATSEDATEAEFGPEATLDMTAEGAVYYSVGDYDIYNITVITDGNINAVSVGGVVLVKSGNVFVSMNPMTAGVKDISVVAKSGYTAENIEISGTGVSDGSVTLAGTTTTDIVIYITGTEQAPVETVSNDDGMGITDYLLIILVVLVIILAIFVALRMMRS